MTDEQETKRAFARSRSNAGLGVKKHIVFGCFVDRRDGENCVMDMIDGDSISDCNLAESLHRKGATKIQCEYWKPKIDIDICGCCGQRILTHNV